MTTTSLTLAPTELGWKLPTRGRVGMFALIAAEAAIFTIFVVAYLFYIGKSLSGPMPREVLSPPFFYTVCLLSSSVTIHFATKALRGADVRMFGAWWFVTIALGAIFLYGTASEWHRLIYFAWTYDQHQLVRNHLLLAGRTARLSRGRGPPVPFHSDGLHTLRSREARARRANRRTFSLLALRGRSLDCGVHRRLCDWSVNGKPCDKRADSRQSKNDRNARAYSVADRPCLRPKSGFCGFSHECVREFSWCCPGGERRHRLVLRCVAP